MLRIGVLTTDTPHHRFMIREFHRRFPPEAKLVVNLHETAPPPFKRLARRHIRENLLNPWRAFALNPYLFMGIYSKATLEYEVPLFFPDGDDTLPDEFPTHVVHSVNDESSREILMESNPDLFLVIGTGLVKQEIFDMPTNGTVNAHGGLLPGYRGLDTNLWAIYLGRPEDVYVTLHKMDATFDTGPVYIQKQIPPAPDMELSTLRYHNAVLCTAMFVELIERFVAGNFEAMPQSGRENRYFRPMPAILKPRVNRLLREYGRRSVGVR